MRPYRNSGSVTAYTYSADGLRRVRLAGTSTVTYLWDDHVLLRDNAIYTTLPGVTGGLLSAKVGGDHRFYVPDMQGHVRQVTDIDGDAIAEYQYDAWGLIQLTAASAMAFAEWGYTWDGKPGRYYVQQRHLRADLGRWLSVDPVETEPPYTYVGNRPTWAVDPSGRWGARIHYGFTKEWAQQLLKKMGLYSDSVPVQLAWGDITTDWDAQRYPRERYHMRSIELDLVRDDLGMMEPSLAPRYVDLRRATAAREISAAAEEARRLLAAQADRLAPFVRPASGREPRRSPFWEVWQHIGHGLHAMQDLEGHGDYLPVHHDPYKLDNPYFTDGQYDPSHARLTKTRQATALYLHTAFAHPAIRECLRREAVHAKDYPKDYPDPWLEREADRTGWAAAGLRDPGPPRPPQRPRDWWVGHR